MTLLNAASRKLVSAPATSRMIVKSQSRLGSRRFMGGDGGDHEHLTFHPPYNPWVVRGLIGFCVFGGSGVIVYGMVHQQYKQGYWKK